MSKFCVAYINQFDNILEQHIVEAADWREALNKAKPGYAEHVACCPDMETAMQEAFNQDWNFHVIEIK